MGASNWTTKLRSVAAEHRRGSFSNLPFYVSSPFSPPTAATTRGFLAFITADAPTSHRQRIDPRRPDAPFLSRRSVHRFLAILTAYARRRHDARLPRHFHRRRSDVAPTTPRPPTPRRPRLSPAARPIDTDAPTSRRPLRPRHVCTPTSILDAPFYRRFDTRRPPDLPTLPAQLYARPPSHTLRRRPPYGTRTRVTTPKRRTFALRRRLRRRPPDFRPPSPPFSSSARTATEPRDRPT